MAYSHLLASSLALGLTAGGCADSAAELPPDNVADPQLPPRDPAALQTWLSAGYYQAWHCEAAPHAGRPPSPHGTNRVCNNDALHAAAAGSGAFPVGAAAVKEVLNGSAITAYSAARKLRDSDGGGTWYWYEGNLSQTSTSGEGAAVCTHCHVQAARDYVFTVVP
jgi:hypothetical protein